MRLGELLSLVEYKIIYGGGGLINAEVAVVTDNSAECCSESVFFCIEGRRSDGHLFACEAVENGACFLICSDGRGEEVRGFTEPFGDVGIIEVKDTRSAYAKACGVFYGVSSSETRIICVTGTNGKTSVATMIRDGLCAYGRRAALLGTLGGSFEGEEFGCGTMTTPDPKRLYFILSEFIARGAEYIVMEAFDNSGEVSFRVIRTDTAVNPGNSGGGLFNSAGELIGIINAKPKLSSIVGVGYAIPSNVVRAIADNIIDYCYGKDCKSVMRGLLGITVTTTALNTKYDPETGLFSKCEEVSVYEVSDGGIAKGILEQGDVIKAITIGNKTVTVTRQYHLIDAMLDVRVGDKVSLTIIRNGVEKTVSTTITEACLAAY